MQLLHPLTSALLELLQHPSCHIFVLPISTSLICHFHKLVQLFCIFGSFISSSLNKALQSTLHHFQSPHRAPLSRGCYLEISM
ncbi:hypothetical protein I3760_04G146400 [Carya illinoinensis]|nr:hypothetical protein I3760_04G146400 [Carya illinoinensis]